LPPRPPDALPALVDSVWVVSESDGVAAGARYAFLTGGRLIVDAGAGGGSPMVGRQFRAGTGLVLVGDSIAYPTDIVEHDAKQLVLRSHNPGGTLMIHLVAPPGSRRGVSAAIAGARYNRAPNPKPNDHGGHDHADAGSL
jgi:hypothetical protein